MPTLTITKTYADATVLTEADLDNIRTDVTTFINTTKLDNANIQAAAITATELDADAVTTVKILDSNVTKAKIEDAQQLPAGMLMDYAGSTEPTGWLFCAGQAVSRTTYADLFAVVSTTYGVGDGSTTFNLPDLRGRVAVGKDNMNASDAGRMTSGGSGVDGDTLGSSGGTETHTLITGEMPAHAHTSHVDTFNAGGSNPAIITGTDDGGAIQATFNETTTTVGSGNAHQNTQPSLIINKIIKT